MPDICSFKARLAASRLRLILQRASFTSNRRPKSNYGTITSRGHSCPLNRTRSRLSLAEQFEMNSKN